MIASVPPAVRAVEVVKVTVAVPAEPTAEPSCNAVAALAITAPTAGVLTNAATVSLDVEIFRPVGEDGLAVTAANAPRVRPLHVTVTAPAARVALPLRVSVMTFVSVYTAPAAVKGAGMPQAALAA